MFKIAFDSIYAHPLPEGHRFPMLKYELIPEQLLREGVISEIDLFSPIAVREENITATHDKFYWEQLRNQTLQPKEQRRIGFPLSERLIERERRIAQGTIDGCLYAQQDGIAFNVAGGTHHAGTNWGEGFCMLNDQAIAANYLLNNCLASLILIIDLDVHQGNGTAQIFQNEARVFTFSMHGANNFPYRKELSNLDVALADDTGDKEYLEILNDSLSKIINDYKPDFIFYLSGVDVLETDKLGKLALSKEGCKQRDEFVFKIALAGNIPVQVSMGGGYSPDIRDIVDAHCTTFKLAAELYY